MLLKKTRSARSDAAVSYTHLDVYKRQGQSFAQEGGFHQPDEYVDCQELLDEAKTLALYLIRTAT